MLSFIKDTKQNQKELEQAFILKDIITINHLSHKMLSMFNQLKIETILPYLLYFEHSEIVDQEQFETLTDHLTTLIQTLENDFNRD